METYLFQLLAKLTFLKKKKKIKKNKLLSNYRKLVSNGVSYQNRNLWVWCFIEIEEN